MSTARPVLDSGRTISLAVGVVSEIVVTERERKASQFVLQIPPDASGRKIAIRYGSDPLADPSTASPGSPRLMGPGVWKIDFYGARIKLLLLDDGSGTGFDVEVFFATGVRTQEGFRSTTLSD